MKINNYFFNTPTGVLNVRGGDAQSSVYPAGVYPPAIKGFEMAFEMDTSISISEADGEEDVVCFEINVPSERTYVGIISGKEIFCSIIKPSASFEEAEPYNIATGKLTSKTKTGEEIFCVLSLLNLREKKEDLIPLLKDPNSKIIKAAAAEISHLLLKEFFDLHIPESGNVKQLSKVALQSYRAKNEEGNDFKFFAVKETDPTAVGEKEKEEIKKGKYFLQTVVPQAQAELVRKLPDWCKITPTMVNLAKTVKRTVNTNRPRNNILLYGTAGGGKSWIVEALSQMLNLPWYETVISEGSDANDITSSFVPYVVGEENSISSVSFEEIENDPAEAYSAITGLPYDEKITAEQAYSAAIKKAKNEENKKSGVQYRKLVSGIINAAKYGGICEIAEPTMARNPGVFTILNSLLDDHAMVELPTGEIVKRHPNCVFCFTTNVSYNGCNAMNQSVLSRCNVKVRVPAPSKDELISFATQRLNIDEENRNDISLMADLLLQIKEFSKENGIENSLSTREFIDWVDEFVFNSDGISSEKEKQELMFSTAVNTVVSSATLIAEEQQEIIDSIFEPKLSIKGYIVEE